MGEGELYKLPSMDDVPWLLGTSKNENAELKKQIFYLINNNSSQIKEIFELSGKSIVASVMGWLILCDRVNSRLYSLWNPVTRNSILLPELPEGIEPYTYIFTSPPKDNTEVECVLLLFCKGLVIFCKPMNADCKWVKQCLKHDSERVRIVHAAVLNGDIYAYADLFSEYDEDDNHGSFHTVFARLSVYDGGDVGVGSLSSVIFEVLSVEFPGSKIVYKMIHRVISYLVEVSGVLYSVSIIPRQLDLENLDGFDILKAFVLRLDFSKMDWVLVDSLDDRALLLGHNCCTWCWVDPSRDRIERDCIYMVNLGSDTIHQYSLQDTSYSFLSSHANFKNSCDAPIWFLPHNRTRLTSLEKTITEKIRETHVEELEKMKTEMSTSLLLELPSGLMASIGDNVHWFDCMNLRATCKKMHCEIAKPGWKANCEYPLFMFLKNFEGVCEIWDPCYKNNGSITKKLPFSPSIVSTIEFCKDGWLVLRSHEGCYLQYMNLITGESGEYPTESLAPGLSNFVLSACPTSPECLTVGVSGMAYVDVSLLRAGQFEWKTYQLDMEGGIDFQSNYNSSPKYHDGAFYFLDENGKLGVLKMLDNGFSWQVYKGPTLEEDSKCLTECYIAEINGQLVCVFIKDIGSKVQVYTFEVNQELWVELKSLGDYTLFLSSASSLSVAAKDSIMKNRIYLPKRIGNEMVFYSLDTGKYHTSSSTKSFENFHGMISQSFSCWV